MVKVLCRDILTIIISLLFISASIGMLVYHSKAHCSISPPNKSIECAFGWTVYCESAVSVTDKFSDNSERSTVCPWSGGIIFSSFIVFLTAIITLIFFLLALREKNYSNAMAFAGAVGLVIDVGTIIVMCIDIKNSFKYSSIYSNDFTLHYTTYIINAVLMFMLIFVYCLLAHMADDAQYWKRGRLERGGLERGRNRNLFRTVFFRFTRSRPQPQAQPQPQPQPQQQIEIQAENPQAGTEPSRDNSNMNLNGDGVDGEEIEP